jgi:hypothetical protein
VIVYANTMSWLMRVAFEDIGRSAGIRLNVFA